MDRSSGIVEGSTPGQAGAYPTTLWSEVRRGGHEDPDLALPALESLLPRYREPLLQHIRSAFRASPESAEDWLQGFLLEKVVLKRLLAAANRDRGRFRTFLLNALDNFIVSEQRMEKAQRRRPEGGWVGLEDMTPGELAMLREGSEGRFAVEWARAVLGQTLARMETECAANGRPERWTVFRRRLLAPLLEGAEPAPYEALVAELAFRSPAEATQALFRAKEMFVHVLREVITEYADSPDAVEDELREFKAALAGS